MLKTKELKDFIDNMGKDKCYGIELGNDWTLIFIKSEMGELDKNTTTHIVLRNVEKMVSKQIAYDELDLHDNISAWIEER